MTLIHMQSKLMHRVGEVGGHGLSRSLDKQGPIQKIINLFKASNGSSGLDNNISSVHRIKIKH